MLTNSKRILVARRSTHNAMFPRAAARMDKYWIVIADLLMHIKLSDLPNEYAK